MGLKEYKQKRDFQRTPEPAGAVATRSRYSFVVQKHAASRLHYDFRLELEGVLKSWAIPKGPSYDTREKRLAVHVEDHPVEYGSFEGIIPKGEYGGGSVMIWDEGLWAPLDDDPVAAYRKGVMKFELQGKKLLGKWTLIRMKPRPGEKEGPENWLLIKERDEYVRPLSEFDVIKAFPNSAISGRTMDQIARDQDDVWHSESSGFAPESLEKIQGAKEAKLPDWVEPELATLVDDVPTTGDYVFEIKLDGYRQLCRIDGREVRFLSRNRKDWTANFSSLVPEVRRLSVGSALLDGEIVATLPDGTTSFQALQNSLSGSTASLIYYVFDLLYLEGFDLRKATLKERKRLLKELLSTLPSESRLKYSDHFSGDGASFFQEVCKRSLEGVICKRADRPYASGRTKDWLKIKCLKRQEFVVGGYTDPSGGRKGLGALLLGVPGKGDKLVFAGRVGTGFTERTLKDLCSRLEPLEIKEAPFSNPPKGAAGRGVHWVKPELVAEVAFSEWTDDGQLRHPSFQGLREDKAADEVTLEKPTKAPAEAKRPADASAREESAGGRKPGPEKIAGITLSHPDRVLYPEAGITKRELAEYYVKIADWIMPYLKDRPLTLIRCPDGWNEQCFYQKHVDKDAPSSVLAVPIEEEGGEKYYHAVRSIEGVVFFVQRSVLEFHPWGSRVDKLDRPDIMIFDLDPDSSLEWPRVVEAAQVVRGLLDLLGLKAFVKTTGGKGLHVVVPLMTRKHSWGEVKGFSKAVVERIAQTQPKAYTTTMSKTARKGKIYLDYLRNARGSNAIAPYSTRAKPGAPVATPIAWEELESGIRSDSFTVRDIPERLGRLKSDPWKDFFKIRQTITAAMKRKVGFDEEPDH